MNASVDPLIDELKSKIIRTFELNLAPDQLDSNAPMLGTGLGLDSIDALELTILVEKDYGVTIGNGSAATQAFASITALAGYIRQHQPVTGT